VLAVVTILAIACGGTAKVKVMGVGLVNVYIYILLVHKAPDFF
jgi:hypothetical protein